MLGFVMKMKLGVMFWLVGSHLALSYLSSALHVMEERGSKGHLVLTELVGVPLPPSVSFITGYEGFPAYNFGPEANVGRLTQIFVPEPFFRDFAMIVTLRASGSQGGVLFAITDASQKIVHLGLALTPVEDKTQRILMYYTEPGAAETQQVASFKVPDMTQQWNRFTLTVEQEEVRLYMDCEKFQSAPLKRSKNPLSFEPGSGIFVANAGRTGLERFVLYFRLRVAQGFPTWRNLRDDLSQGSIQQLVIKPDPRAAGEQCEEDDPGASGDISGDGDDDEEEPHGRHVDIFGGTNKKENKEKPHGPYSPVQAPPTLLPEVDEGDFSGHVTPVGERLFRGTYKTEVTGESRDGSGQGHKGERGEPGPPGLPGPPGPSSPPRHAGQPGQRGPQGPIGPPGQPGRPGKDGQPGSKGEEGQRGLPGSPGISGGSGIKGGKGDSGVGQPGPPGLPGLPGPPGPSKPIKVPYGFDALGSGSGSGEVYIDSELLRGPPGPPGMPGPPGPNSASGGMVPEPTGAPGVPGKDGLDGLIGKPGLPGVPGQEGTLGPHGPKGEKGEQGIRGPPGPKGENGNPGFKGHPGPRAPIGPRGVPGPPGPPGPPGNSFMDLEGSGESSLFLGARISKGHQGIPGLPGPPGPPGHSGVDGAPGLSIKGERGAPGPDGVEGLAGLPGARGPKGEKSSLGQKGERGRDGLNITGPPGPPGPPGPIQDIEHGPEGLPGRPGFPGPRGPKGEIGIPGIRGPTGLKGEKGDAGVTIAADGSLIAGLRGPRGPKGNKGDQGPAGEFGIIGPVGPPGQKGEYGIPGRPGRPGMIGGKGDKGDASGSPGPPGPPGAPGRIISLKGINNSTSQQDEGESLGVKGGKDDVGYPGLPEALVSMLPNDFVGAKGDTGYKGQKGEKGDPSLRGPPGPPGRAGLVGPKGDSIVGPPGEPGARGFPGQPGYGSQGPQGPPGAPGLPGTPSVFGSAVSLPGPPGPPGPPAQVSTHKNTQELIENHQVAIGNMGYVLDSSELYIRVSQGWRKVQLGELIPVPESNPSSALTQGLSRPSDRSIPQVNSQGLKNDLSSYNILPHTAHPMPGLHLVALNAPFSGDMRGIRGADYQCYQQARARGLTSTYRAFLSSHLQDLSTIVRKGDRFSLPVVNLKGDVLFSSWMAMFSGNGAVFDPLIPIYSFDGRNVMTDQSWPEKLVWHGSSTAGIRMTTNYCEAWRTGDMAVIGQASLLQTGRLLGQHTHSCSNNFIVLCIENSSMQDSGRH